MQSLSENFLGMWISFLNITADAADNAKYPISSPKPLINSLNICNSPLNLVDTNTIGSDPCFQSAEALYRFSAQTADEPP